MLHRLGPLGFTFSFVGFCFLVMPSSLWPLHSTNTNTHRGCEGTCKERNLLSFLGLLHVADLSGSRCHHKSVVISCPRDFIMLILIFTTPALHPRRRTNLPSLYVGSQSLHDDPYHGLRASSPFSSTLVFVFGLLYDGEFGIWT
jgi:hypothetical protein